MIRRKTTAKPARSRLVTALPLISTLVFTCLYLIEPGAIDVIRHAVFDQYQRWQPRSNAYDEVRIIDIDDESLKRLGQWPWPRTKMAELTNRLAVANPKVIAFDILFSEADRTSPKAMLDLWHPSAQLSQQLATLPDHDQVFADSLRQTRSVLGFTLTPEGKMSRLPYPLPSYVSVGPFATDLLHNFRAALPALSQLEHAVEGSGALIFIPDVDGVLRRIPLMLRLDDTLLPSFSSEVVRVAQREKNYILHSADFGASNSLVIGNIAAQSSQRGEAWLNFSSPDSARYIPAWKIMADLVPVEQLAGKILIIGASAQGLMDRHATPLGDLVPGVEIHAQAIDQMLQGTFLMRPYWSELAELAVILFGGVLISLITQRQTLKVSVTLGALATAVLLVAGCWGFYRYRVLLDPITPLLALFITYSLASSVRYLNNERHQRWLQQALSSYLSPNLVEYLINNPKQLELSGQRRECSFVFTDLEGFTSFMEKIDPVDAVAVLNEYLDSIVAIAFKYDGTLDRVVGDSVAIMFSAPVKQRDHKQRALECGLEIDAFASDFTYKMNLQGIALGQTRIGVHSGKVVVGNIGGSSLFDYRALGDAVNTASRLQGANKYLGTTICVSEATFSGCTHIQARPIGRLLLKGKQEPLLVYQPTLKQMPLDQQYLMAYELMAGYDPAALQRFEELDIASPDDCLIKLHLTRLKDGEQGELIELKNK